MTDQGSYGEAYGLFVDLSDRFGELSDEQHVCVMEAFNCLTDPDIDTDTVTPSTLPIPTNAQADGPVDGPTKDPVGGLVDGPVEASVEQVLAAAAAALARLVEGTEDGAAALIYARSHALLIAALAAE
jgi:hypothetical protein